MSTAITLQDLVSHVMDVFDLSENHVDVRRAIRSSLWGYEQATTRHQWTTYDSQVSVYFNDAYSTGTIAIDSAGVVSLVDGVFPAWANLASVYLGEEKAYRVKSRNSDTQLTLEHWTGQAQSSIAYVLRQDRVILPDEVRTVFDAWNESEDWSLKTVDPRTFRDYDKPTIHSGADPCIATFRSVLLDGEMKTEFRVSPGVTKAVEVDIAYLRKPKKAKTLATGLASASSGVVTLSKPLPIGPSVVGAMVRHASGRAPTADFEFGIQTPLLASFEGLVTEQQSTTSFTVPDIPDFTDERIVITDVLDIPSFAMLPVQMYAEAHMARIGRGDIREYRVLMQEADEQLRYAMEQDSSLVRRSGRGAVPVDRLEKTIYVSEN